MVDHDVHHVAAGQRRALFLLQLLAHTLELPVPAIAPGRRRDESRPMPLVRVQDVMQPLAPQGTRRRQTGREQVVQE